MLSRSLRGVKSLEKGVRSIEPRAVMGLRWRSNRSGGGGSDVARRGPRRVDQLASPEDTFDAMRRNMDRMMQDAFRPFGNALTNPFSFFDQMSREMDRLGDQLKHPDKYEIKADVPGVKKEDIKVEANDDMIQLTVEHEEGRPEAAEGERSGEDAPQYRRMERSYGKVSRSFQVPHDADTSSIKAKCENGVLTLTLPKTQKSIDSRRTIEVE